MYTCPALTDGDNELAGDICGVDRMHGCASSGKMCSLLLRVKENQWVSVTTPFVNFLRVINFRSLSCLLHEAVDICLLAFICI